MTQRPDTVRGSDAHDEFEGQSINPPLRRPEVGLAEAERRRFQETLERNGIIRLGKSARNIHDELSCIGRDFGYYHQRDEDGIQPSEHLGDLRVRVLRMIDYRATAKRISGIVRSAHPFDTRGCINPWLQGSYLGALETYDPESEAQKRVGKPWTSPAYLEAARGEIDLNYITWFTSLQGEATRFGANIDLIIALNAMDSSNELKKLDQ